MCGLIFILMLCSVLKTPIVTSPRVSDDEEYYLRCGDPGEAKFFLPKKNLKLTCNLAASKAITISKITLRLYNQSSSFRIPISVKRGETSWVFDIVRANLTSNYTDWTTKGQWAVYTDIMYSTGRKEELQGSLLDDLTEPILQWSLGTPVGQTGLKGVNCATRILISQSPCALDVVLISPAVESESLPYFAITKNAFDAGTMSWFAMTTLCAKCQVLDLVLTNRYLLVLTTKNLYVSNCLTDPSFGDDFKLRFSPVVSLENCASVKSGWLDFTSVCHNHVDSDFEVDIVALFYLCDSGKVEPMVYLSSEESNFTKWVFAKESLMHRAVSDVTVGPETQDLFMIYDSNSSPSIVVHHIWRNMSVDKAMVIQWDFVFKDESLPLRIFVHPISNFIYAYGKWVWTSTNRGLSFRKLEGSFASGKIKFCASRLQNGAFACVTSQDDILYGNPLLGRMWNVKTSNLTAITSASMAFFDYVGDLYVGCLVNDAVVISKINIVDGIKKGTVRFKNPLMVQSSFKSRADFYEYAISDNNEFGLGTLGLKLSNSIAGSNGSSGSVVIKDVTKFKTTGFVTRIVGLIVDKLAPDSTSASLGSDLELVSWSANSYEGEFNFPKGSWTAADLYKTISIPFLASFLITEISSSTKLKVRTANYVQTMMSIKSGAWKLYDFRASSWVLSEDECRHVIDTPRSHIIDVDLGRSAKVDISLNLKAPYEVGSNFLYAYLSNPSVFRAYFTRMYSDFPLREKLNIEIVPVFNVQAASTLRVHSVGSSMLCKNVPLYLSIRAACPSTQMLIFVYPHNITQEDFLPDTNTSEKEEHLINIIANYRPPSNLGYGIPTSSNIYNADPSLPRPNDDFKISKKSGQLKQCKDANSRSKCGCTEAMIMTDDSRYSDCKMRALKMEQPAILNVSLLLMAEYGVEEIPEYYAVKIYDVNNRYIHIKYEDDSQQSVFLQLLESDSRFKSAIGRFYKPDQIVISMEGTGLYHLRAELMPNLSFCPLSTEFQVYVVPVHLQYPVNFLLNFLIALLLGAVLFFVALWYILKHVPQTSI